jgi:hypothetical protein
MSQTDMNEKTYQCENCKAWQYNWNINCHTCNFNNLTYLKNTVENYEFKPDQTNTPQKCLICNSFECAHLSV